MEESGLLPESAKPYLLNAIYTWCLEQGYTPYVLVVVDYPGVAVPPGYDRDGRMILDISPRASHGLVMADGWISFSARFGGVARPVDVPMGAVVAIYAAETQEGMGFGEPVLPSEPPPPPTPGPSSTADGEAPRAARPQLRVVK
jgi:stringent starvation protein B